MRAVILLLLLHVCAVQVSVTLSVQFPTCVAHADDHEGRDRRRRCASAVYFELYFCLSIQTYSSIQAYDAAIWCPASGVGEGE